MSWSPWSQSPSVADYGGARDKMESASEDVPYAWTWYEQLSSALPDAFTDARTGLVHARKVALSRALAGLRRAAEKLSTNAFPGSADERLPYWAEVLAVTGRQGESVHELRKRCAARYRSAGAPARHALTRAVSTLLGPAFVGLYWTEGTDLASDPGGTRWPGGSPGLPDRDVSGAGQWSSSRAHLHVGVQLPPGMSLNQLVSVLDGDLHQLLDDTLPSWSTFDWGFDSDDGFHLDIDPLDITAL